MNTKTPIIAFDIHPTRIGYAVVVNGFPIDWGVTRLRQSPRKISKHLRKTVGELCRLWQPAVAVVKASPRNGKRHLDVIRRALDRLGIHFIINRVGDRDRSHTRYQGACNLAHQFPQLRQSLPPKRRLWQSEDDRMYIFAAIELAA